MSIITIAIATTVVVLAAVGIKGWLLWQKVSAAPEPDADTAPRDRGKNDETP